MGRFRIFIIEDDPWYGEILEHHLSKNEDLELHRFACLKDCFAQLSKKPDLITLDFSLPDGRGDTALKRFRKEMPQVPVIIISAQQDVAVAVELLKEGATDYFVKDEHTHELLWNLVHRLKAETLSRQETTDTTTLSHEDFSKEICGSSPAMKKVFQVMRKAAQSHINVSISGETGTGKEVVARAIHRHSTRRARPMVVVNMAAIPKELIESELFGHEKGAFTGAASRRIGRFEEANKGTLFLDEIAELDLSIQSKLLRVLQERELVRVGGSVRIPLDVRLIVATHKNLSEEVQQGRFREDLYYRTLGMPIQLPPLRERGNDTLLLARYFLTLFCKQNKTQERSFSADALEKLSGYSFPGNVRELKALVDLAAVMSDELEIGAGDIQLPGLHENALPDAQGKTMREYTTELIRYYLRQNNNNVQAVARRLQIGKSTIYKMIQDKELALDPDPPGDR
ncbi:MAG: sigma-54-dependent Fis family transcriptional regulator [Bacteroidetes bacterium]|nr:sigma-54-dependent Fis family transcriptional regulator [Bacteroidota bacterium]MBS1628770.1 sigma-54-dependent Fis family transcriptional regulator [Bacteroidota bacterium]